MIEDLTAYVDFLTKYKITPEQFLLPYCLHLDEVKGEDERFRRKSGRNRPMANLYRYATQVKVWKNDDIEHLMDVGLIESATLREAGDGKGYAPDALHVTPKFREEIFSNTTSFDEFWETYPGFIRNFENPLSGPYVTLKAVAMDEAENLYNKMVPTMVEHLRMMRVLRWAKENDHIRCKITNWLSSKMWRDLETIMKSDIENGFGTAL